MLKITTHNYDSDPGLLWLDGELDDRPFACCLAHDEPGGWSAGWADKLEDWLGPDCEMWSPAERDAIRVGAEHWANARIQPDGANRFRLVEDDDR